MGKGRNRAKRRLKKLESIYEPLPEGGYIRTLVLQPGRYDDEIVCALEIQSHTSDKSYSAISYVWGNANETTNIRCNGLAVPITFNLEHALRQFRSPVKTKRLWADALCINQRDNEEKGHQVSHMGEVYSNAKCVLIWLGLDTNDVAKNCFTRIEIINDFFNRQFVENGYRPAGLPILKAPYAIPLDHETWQEIHTLLHLPWFERVWTIQECALATRCRVFWGPANISFSSLVELSLWCKRHRGLHSLLKSLGSWSFSSLAFLFQNVYCYFRKEQSWQCSRPILEYDQQEFQESCLAKVLVGTSGLRVTDPRDFVYALLGCRYAKNEKSDLIIDVDYSRSVWHVYHNLAATLLRDPKEGPWLLSSVTRSSRSRIVRLTAPTWMPRWDFNNDMLADHTLDYQAGGPPSTYKASLIGDLHLQLSGFLFDTIVWKTDTFKETEFLLAPSSHGKINGESFFDRLLRVVKWAALDLRLNLDEDVLFQTLTNADRHVLWWRSICLRIEDYRRVARAFACQRKDFVEEHTSNEEMSAAIQCADYLRDCTAQECLFMTKEGRIGLGPGAATEVGDSCCIFMGATVPFVLAPGNDGRFRLVGECYVQGVMLGELIGKLEPTDLVLE